jgi:hypothetical protein
MIPRKSMTYFNKIKPALIPVLILLFAFGVAFTHYDQPVQASGSYNVTLDWVFMSDQWYPPAASWGNCGTIQCNGPADVGNTCTSHVKTGFTTCYNGDTSNCGNQADSVYSCKGPPACVPSNACAASTCNTTTCGDGCGGQVPGTQVCGPVCSSSMGQACGLSNACNSTSGTYQCDGSCSAPAPAPVPSGYGGGCSVSNSCGSLTNSGTIDCGGTCNAAAPSEASCTSAPSAPTVSFSGNPLTVSSGGASTLTWTSTNATSCTSPDFATGNAANNSTGVSTGALAASKTYHLSCTGAGGTTAATPVTITVSAASPPPPTCTESGPGITANPTRVESGQSVTLNWSGTTAAAGCTIIGPNGFSQAAAVDNACNISAGSATISNITAQSVYTLTCPGGQTSSVVVNIIPKFKEF